MIPYILAAVGGYLIGDSLKGQQFAEGGSMPSKKRFYEGQSIMLKPIQTESLKKALPNWNNYANKEIVIEKIEFDIPHKKVTKAFVRKTGEEVPFAFYLSDAVEQYAEGGMMAKGGKAESESIREHYINSYPTDELGSEINPKATFDGLYKVLEKGKDAYAYIGVFDSIVRERIFEKLADLKGVDYEVIYTMWLSAD